MQYNLFNIRANPICTYEATRMMMDISNIAFVRCCVRNSTEIIGKITDACCLQANHFERIASNFAVLLIFATPCKWYKHSENPLLSLNNSKFFNTKYLLS